MYKLCILGYMISGMDCSVSRGNLLVIVYRFGPFQGPRSWTLGGVEPSRFK